nr:helix-turn-helix domain-containing protein [Streptomyces sp. SID4985]
MPVAKIAQVTFTSPDRVRDVIHNFNADGFDSLCPTYKGGRPRTFTLPERREIKKIAKSKPVEHGLPFSTWSLAKLADFLVAEGVVDDISHEGLRILLREEGVSFQCTRGRRTRSRLMPGRVRPAQPPAPPRAAMGRARREAQGPRPGTPPPQAGDLHPPARGQAPVRRLRPG